MKNKQKTSNSIRLHKEHVPLHHKLNIRNQEDYDNQIGMLLYLINQIQSGFIPQYMITLHPCHPSELVAAKKETKNELGWRDRITFISNKPLWDEVSQYNYWHRHRNDLHAVEKDAKAIRNLILQRLFGIKRLEKDHNKNILIFLEKGKVKLQYHMHILIPEVDGLSAKDVEHIFIDQIRPRVKCLSLWKQPRVDMVYDINNIISYVNKEVHASHCSLCSYSLPIKQ